MPTPSATMGATTGAPTAQKAFLMLDPEFAVRYPIGKPPPPTLICQYNPKDLTISGGTDFREPDTNVSEKLPTSYFVKPQPRTMKLKLFFDKYPDGDVSLEMYTLWDWTQPRKSVMPPNGQVSAPWVRFQWGYKNYFRCYIQSLSVTYTMFLGHTAARHGRPDVEGTCRHPPLHEPDLGWSRRGALLAGGRG